jgi:predicted nucleotidyltransferase
MTGRQVQQLAGVHNLTANKCLDELERLGLILRWPVGRAYLYSLKRSHCLVRHLVDPIFKAEEAVPSRFAGELERVFCGECLSAVVYGSVARGEEHSASDVDLFVVVEGERDAARFIEKVQPRAEKLVRESWGLMLEVIVKTRSQLLSSWSSPLVKRIRREGCVVTGVSLVEVQHGRCA